MPSVFFEDLKILLERLPGIGPRQASRFIWALLDFEQKDREKLAGLINELDKHLSRCGVCLRIFAVATQDAAICSFCNHNSKRDHSKIMVLERDSDLLNMEKSGIYKGLYHVLGGMIDPLDKNLQARENIKKLYERISRSSSVFPREIILALSPAKLGEFTASYIEKVLEPLVKSQKINPSLSSNPRKGGVKITRLARGLATGTELEYADETTLKQALENRK